MKHFCVNLNIFYRRLGCFLCPGYVFTLGVGNTILNLKTSRSIIRHRTLVPISNIILFSWVIIIFKVRGLSVVITSLSFLVKFELHSDLYASTVSTSIILWTHIYEGGQKKFISWCHICCCWFFGQWDSSTATLMKEMHELQGDDVKK